MFDIKYIRDNPKDFDAALKRRGLSPKAEEILKMDKSWREATTMLQQIRSEHKENSKKFGILKSKGEDTSKLSKTLSLGKEMIKSGEEIETARKNELEEFLADLPNLPYDNVPEGKTEADNPVLREAGERPEFSFEPRQHFDLGEALGLMDFEAAAKISGARFVILKGALARLERALGQFMVDLALENGYREVSTPSLVRGEALFGTGQLPKFAEDLFRTENDYWLIPTAEVTLSNLHRGDILAEEDLPLRFCALTPCYRAEAGAAGKDTRGMIRQHQFTKVELVSITKPSQSPAEHERMTGCAEQVLEKLGLPYRAVELCTGDLGFSARKTFDLEVWLPGQKKYREISSCSDCGDFQARRMNMRMRKKGQKETRYPHTLNGSGLAVGRTLVAILENYQNEDGTITVPDLLKPYMGGLSKIEKA